MYTFIYIHKYSQKGAMNENLEDSELLAFIVSEVLETCFKWTADLVAEYLISPHSVTIPPQTLQMQSEGRVFLLFIELCHRRSEVSEGLTNGSLQHPKLLMIEDSSNVLSIGIAKKSLGFTIATVSTESISPSDKLLNLSTQSEIGQKALDIVTLALESIEDLCIDIDLNLQQTFHDNATINNANMSWLSIRIKELACAIQSVSPSILDLMQSSALSFDGNGDTDGSSSARIWHHACFGDKDELNLGRVWGTNPSVPLVQGTSKEFSLQGLEAVAYMARSEILRLYTEARSRAVLFSILTATGGSLHPTLTSLITAELLPQVYTYIYIIHIYICIYTYIYVYTYIISSLNPH
jgi:hypothetical protein